MHAETGNSNCHCYHIIDDSSRQIYLIFLEKINTFEKKKNLDWRRSSTSAEITIALYE